MEYGGGETGKWDTYIHRVLKEVRPKLGLSSDGKRVFCDILCYISDKISVSAVSITKHAGKITVSNDEIITAVKIVLGECELMKHAYSEIKKAITKYNQTSGGNNRARESRAGLTFSVSRAENDIRNHLSKDMRASESVGVSLAATLEYLSAEIIELSGNKTQDDGRTYITPRDIFMTIAHDEELNSLLKYITISKGGVLPYINTKLLGGSYTALEITKNGIQRLAYRGGVKFIGGLVYEEIRGVMSRYLKKLLYDVVILCRRNKRKTVAVKDLEEALNIKSMKNYSEFNKIVGGRFKPGTVALRNIRKYQKSTKLLLQKAPFQRLVRDICSIFSKDLRFEEAFFDKLQTLVEDYLVTLFHNANIAALHAERQTIQPKDIVLVRRIQQS